MKLKTEPSTVEERVAYLAEALAGLYSGPAQPAPTRGGRRAALDKLRRFRLRGYAQSRNNVGQRGVSALSPYIRHGALTLAEVRDAMLTRYGSDADSTKFVNELAWRAFWQLVYADLGERVQQDIEPPKHRRKRIRGLPKDLASGNTGLVCIDESLRELFSTGYMHNHGRMWVAAYVQHWRGIDWRDGAQLFYQHLLDGDPASNNLSWQWVGSTFSHKPYFFNKANVERFTAGSYCARCPLNQAGCPFDASYEQLALDLFGVTLAELEGQPMARKRR